MTEQIKNLKMETFSIADLEALVARASELLDAKREEKASEIASQMQELAKKEGLPFGSVLVAAGARPARSNGYRSPRYRHPEKGDLTWSGTGRKPRWVKDWEQAGRSIEECTIVS